MEKTSDKLDDHDGVKEQKQQQQQEEEDIEAAELILFQVSECYVYLVCIYYFFRSCVFT